VWDANHGPDAGEVWTPEFDTGLPALDVDVPDSPSGAGGDDREAARPEPSLQAATPDEPVVHDTAPHHDRPTTPHHTTPDEPDVRLGHAHVAANEHHTTPDEPDVRQGHAHVAASGHDGATGRVNGHGPAPDSDAGDVPPPLESQRNPRRPDVPADPLEALQSLQAQLERLATGRRPARPPASRTGSRASGSGTDRHERH
jgi:hypothetical protein